LITWKKVSSRKRRSSTPSRSRRSMTWSEELNALLRCCDKGQKGYIATSKFIEQLYSLASESEGDVILRRLAKTLSHS